MGLIAIPAGAYSITWDGNVVGLLEGQPKHVEKIAGIAHKGHLFGDNTIELVDTGIESMFVLFTLKEWSADIKKILWPWNATMGITGVPFKVASDARLKALVFTAEAGTRAATLGPVTRTYHQAGLANAQSVEHAIGGGERNIPVIMQVIPVAESPGSRSLKYYTDT